MATCQDIIRRAMRVMGLLQGGQEPSGADAADGLERLQSIVMGLPGLALNGYWREKAVSAAYTAREGERITVTGAVAITLPATITPPCGDGDGDSDDIRPPKDLAKVQIIGASVANPGVWLYSATKAAW